MQKRIQLIVLFLLFSLIGRGNVAEPGVWSSGGAGNYTLLFPGDSSYYQKIQMQQELVFIQLYPGFAVVKGMYWMRNTTSDTIVMNAGYPVNTGFEPRTNQWHGKLNVDFDDLYSLRVSTNGIPRIFSRKQIERPQPNSFGDKQDWYTWQDTFLPDTTSLIEIYFIVNTNNSEIIDGYSHSKDNVFVYLLESGASWKPPIGKGDFYVMLSDDLSASDIRGISPENIFSTGEEKKTFHYHFENFVPDQDRNNIVIAYGKKIGIFYFSDVVKKADSYFEKIDEFQNMDLSKADSKSFNPGNPYYFESGINNPMIIFMLFLVGLAGLIVLVVFLLKTIHR